MGQGFDYDEDDDNIKILLNYLQTPEIKTVNTSCTNQFQTC